MSEPVIELSHVYKTYNNDRHALKNLSLEINAGEFVFLTGPSGAGKSTLFKILSAQESTTSGTASVFQTDLKNYSFENIHSYRKKIGVIFQNFKLIGELTNKENLTIPLAQSHLTKSEINFKVEEVVDLVGLNKTDLAEYPEALSGGQQQKVAIARAIIHKPKLILADEPTGNLDKAAALNILMILKELTKWKTTIFFATHDENLIKSEKARVLNLNGGELL